MSSCCSPASDTSDGGVTTTPDGPAMPNTLATTLVLFPLAETHESRDTGKRRREKEKESEVITSSSSKKLDEALHDVLFPTEDEMLGDTIDRLRVSNDTSLKRRKMPIGDAAVSVMNRRVMAMLEQTTILPGSGKGRPVLGMKPIQAALAQKQQREAIIHIPRKSESKVSTFVVQPDQSVAKLQQSIRVIAKPTVKQYVYMLPNEFGVRMVSPYKLFDYQADTVKWMIEREEGKVRNEYYAPGTNGCLLAMVMGLGKTPTAATLVARTISQQRAMGSCSIYVCPKNLVGTVRHEFEKFFGDQLKIIIYHQNFLRSEYNTFGVEEIRKYDVIITNYNTVTSRMGAYNKALGISATTKKTKPKKKEEKQVDDDDDDEEDEMQSIIHYKSTTGHVSKAIRDFCEFKWFRIILDESHEIRERKTARFFNMMQMQSSRRICLTGTPIHNKVNDLYSQMEFTGLRLPRGTKQIKQNLHKMNIINMIKFVEYKDAQSVVLPPKIIHKIYFNLSEEEKLLQRFYTENARSVFIQQENTTGGGRSKGRRTFEALAGMMRVLQVCSAPYLVTPASKESVDSSEDMCDVAPSVIFPADPHINTWIHRRDGTAGIESSKMREFVKLMATLRRKYDEEKSSLKVVVFANMTSTLRLAQAALQKHVKDYEERTVMVTGNIAAPVREELFTRFRINPHVETLFMTLKLGSIGLNLTEADTVIFLEPWYSYASLSQGESRVHRIGQIREVNVFYLLGKDSAEERVYRVAQNKKSMSDDVKAGTAEAHKLQADEMRFILMDVDEPK